MPSRRKTRRSEHDAPIGKNLDALADCLAARHQASPKRRMSRAHRYDHLLTDGAIALLDNKSLLTNTAYYDERYGTVLTKVDMVDMICHLRRMADRARKQALPKVQAYNAEAVLSSVCCSLFRTIEENACDYFTACLSRLGIEERCVTLSRYRIPIRHQVRDILGSAQDHPHFRSLLVKYLSFTLNQWH